MKLPGALKYLTFSMVILGVLSLLLTLRDIQFVTLDLIVLIMLILAGSLFFWETKLHTKPYLIVWNLVTILYVLYLLLNFQTQNVIVTAAYLSIFLQIFKCYNRKTNKDYIQMYLISFFQFISCTGITTNPAFFVYFIVYVFVALWALITFHMKRRLEKYSVAQFSDREGSRYLVAGGLMNPEDIEEVNLFRKQALQGVVTPGFLGGTFLMGVLILVCGLVLFYVLPRPTQAGSPSFLASIGQEFGKEKFTGLSDEVDLSTGGKIIDDETMVMKIKPLEPVDVPVTILWRAGALNYFDGKSWRNTIARGVRKTPGADGIVVTGAHYVAEDIRSLDDLRSLPDLVEYRVHVENSEVEKMVSAFRPPVAFAGIEGRVLVDGNETYSLKRGGQAYGRYLYDVFSEREGPPEKILRKEIQHFAVDPRIRRWYIFIPGVPDIVDETLREIDIGKYGNMYDKVKAIEEYLEENLSYTMDIRRTEGVDSPVEDFLVYTKSGHCELFATAMAVLCRRAGIPTRLAYGYKTSEWNEYGQFYQVRHRDAHAWVEVFFSSVDRWVYFDPSPMQPASDAETGIFRGFLSHLGRFVEALKSKWYDSVVFYDLSKQKHLAMTLIEKAVRVGTRLKVWAMQLKRGFFTMWSWFSGSRVTAAIAIISTISVLVAAVLLVKKKLISHTRFKHSYQRGILRLHYHKVRFYEKMLKILMGIEIIKPENVTPMEFARELEAKDQSYFGIRYVTELYYSVRYGDVKPELAQLRKVAGILSNLRKTTFLKR